MLTWKFCDLLTCGEEVRKSGIHYREGVLRRIFHIYNTWIVLLTSDLEYFLL